MLISEEKHIGKIDSIGSSAATVLLDDDLEKMERSINNKVVRVGEIGSFVLLPAGDVAVIGMITRVLTDTNENKPASAKLMEIQMVGTLRGEEFEKGIEKFPLLGGDAYVTDEDDIYSLFSTFAQFGFAVGDISGFPGKRQYINPNKFFGKHIAVLGTTGAGKSTAVTSIMQKVQMLFNTHIIIIDVHNEYSSAFKLFGKLVNITELELPYWFMNFEEMVEMFVDEREPSAQSQIMMLRDLVLSGKKAKNPSMQDFITVDTPVYFDIREVRSKFQYYDSERISGPGGVSREGPFFGQFSRFLLRLDSRMSDKRYEFMFKPKKFKDSSAIQGFITQILGLADNKQISVIDISGVPFDIVNTIVSLLARTVFDFNFWNVNRKGFPILLVFEEAHNYLPRSTTTASRAAVRTVERISKEGRKYGVSCLLISQRPSELSQTILAQCNNFVILRLTNATDQEFVKNLIPDTYAGMLEVLPTLRVGEALIIGDSVGMPVRVIFDFPAPPPNSEDVHFYDNWIKTDTPTDVAAVIAKWWKQDRTSEKER